MCVMLEAERISRRRREGARRDNNDYDDDDDDQSGGGGNRVKNIIHSERIRIRMLEGGGREGGRERGQSGD